MADHPVVSHRNHFTAVEEVVEMEMAYLRMAEKDLTEEAQSRIRAALLSACSKMLRWSVRDLITATGRGMEQAIELILDPGYYETKKKRAARNRSESAKKAAEERKSALVKKVTGPTAEEMERERMNLERQIHWYQCRADEMREQLRLLVSKKAMGTVGGIQ